MTLVNVTAVTNTVAVTEDGSGTVVTVTTAGPQGPSAIVVDGGNFANGSSIVSTFGAINGGSFD
jgi:hypothetical protein